MLLQAPASAIISVSDDAGQPVLLKAPARRIVSLSPHATELLHAAGAGGFIVGVSEYSNYPPEAKHIPSIGSAMALDLERIISLKPDLVIAWNSGNSATQVARLRAAGIPVFESEPRDFATVASSLERLGLLADTVPVGNTAAAAFRQRLKTLEATYKNRPVVNVFYQVWQYPLMTVNDAHLVSAAIRLCGGKNVFGDLSQLAPTVSAEAVLKIDPEAIVAGQGEEQDPFANWRAFQKMKAVDRKNLFAINSDWMTRAGPRILDGTELLCKDLEAARSKRK